MSPINTRATPSGSRRCAATSATDLVSKHRPQIERCSGQHRRIRGLPPFAGGHQRLDRKIIIGPGSATRPGIRPHQRPGLVRRGSPTAVRVRAEELSQPRCSPRDPLCTPCGDAHCRDPVPADRRDLLAVPSRLCRNPGVAVQRRTGTAEQPGPEPVDVEPVRRFADVMLGEVLPTLLRHLSTRLRSDLPARGSSSSHVSTGWTHARPASAPHPRSEHDLPALCAL